MLKTIPVQLRWKLLAKLRGSAAATRAFGVQVGEGCRILSFRMGSEPWLISIGNRVTVSADVQFLAHDGIGWLFEDESGRRFRYARVAVGDDVFIGAGAIILPGVSIGTRCVVGAGSVVTRSVPTGYVVAGNPAKIVTSYDELMCRVSKWATGNAMHGATFRERVESITESGFRPELVP